MKNHLLTKVYNRRAITVDEVVEDLRSYAERLEPLVADTCLLLNQALDEGRTVLFEGAQATMLDVDHGTYPFVTSSNPVAGGVCIGAGVGPTRIDRVIGVIKAYTTRVGSGPFPTELFDEDGEKLLEDRRRGRGLDRARPPLRLVRRRDRALRRPGQRAHRVLHDQARRALQLGAGAGVRRLRRRRRAPRRDADDPDGVPPGEAGLRVPRRLERRHLRLPRLRRPAQERPALRARARGDVGRAVLGRRRRARAASRRSSSPDSRARRAPQLRRAPAPPSSGQYDVTAGHQHQQYAAPDPRTTRPSPIDHGWSVAASLKPRNRRFADRKAQRQHAALPLRPPRVASRACVPAAPPCPGRARAGRSAVRAR